MNTPKIVEKPINQRIKFLLEALNLSAREFSRAVEVADNNTQNYLEPRFAQPKADYLEKVLHHFESINPTWLLTGKGEPFLSYPPTMSNENKPVIKKTKGNVQANSGQTVNNIHLDDCKREVATLKAELDASKNEIQLLRDQLALQATLVAAKDETITLLRASYNRPN